MKKMCVHHKAPSPIPLFVVERFLLLPFDLLTHNVHPLQAL